MSIIILQTSRKSNEKLKSAHEKQMKLKEEELSSIKNKSQVGGKKVAEVKQELQAKIDSKFISRNGFYHESEVLLDT